MRTSSGMSTRSAGTARSGRGRLGESDRRRRSCGGGRGEGTAPRVETVREYREAMLSLRGRRRLRRAASHELRSGLTDLTVALDDLRRSLPEGSDLLRHLERAEKSLDGIVALVDDLDPSAPSSGAGRRRRSR